MKALLPAIICAATVSVGAVTPDNTTAVALSTNMNLVVQPSERDRVRRFYHEVLGCRITRQSDGLDIFETTNAFYLGVRYADDAQSDRERARSIWLELRTNDPHALKDRILKFGIPEIAFRDKDHFYFQAPGGQVYRLVRTDEDMTRWQR